MTVTFTPDPKRPATTPEVLKMLLGTPVLVITDADGNEQRIELTNATYHVPSDDPQQEN